MLKKLIDWFTDDNVVLPANQTFKQNWAPKPLIDGDVWINTDTEIKSIWNAKKKAWIPEMPELPTVEDLQKIMDEEAGWERHEGRFYVGSTF